MQQLFNKKLLKKVMQLFLRLRVRTTGRSIFERKRGYHLLASLHAIQLSLRNLSVKSYAMANQKPASKANLEWTAVATGLTLLGDWLANFVLREFALYLHTIIP